jgi:hypothetical protein
LATVLMSPSGLWHWIGNLIVPPDGLSHRPNITRNHRKWAISGDMDVVPYSDMALGTPELTMNSL